MLSKCDGFEWDQGNSTKNWEKHGVSQSECEQAFFNSPVAILPSSTGSGESRLVLLSKSNKGCLLTIIFTIRKTKIRVISARGMSKKERSIYDKENSKF
ncbi:MAG: BrnT family toxin [SAR324 cluster bacterium]|nr:BrnT family toxin [SAR324 cluster bacterium]